MADLCEVCMTRINDDFERCHQMYIEKDGENSYLCLKCNEEVSEILLSSNKEIEDIIKSVRKKFKQNKNDR